jgi:hypothetical protein
VSDCERCAELEAENEELAREVERLQPPVCRAQVGEMCLAPHCPCARIYAVPDGHGERMG